MNNPTRPALLFPCWRQQLPRSLCLVTLFAMPCLVLMAATNTPSSSVAVLTQHNDNARTGMNLAESALNINNVNTNEFGLLFTRAVDDQIYAQPLLMTNVNLVGKGTHNLVIVATVNDTVYAYDADDSSATAPYWTVSFINPPNIVAPRNTDMTGACGGNYKDFSGNMGIVGAPVIDPATSTLYLVARTKEFGTAYVQRLHALDLATGLERPNSPVVIAANNGVAFDPYKHNQRPALLLANGYVYITWASHCDWTPYHGWVIAYNVSDLLQPPISFNPTPSGSQAGVWMSNQGPVADANGNVYVTTGNGTFDGINNFGQCFLKLSPSGGNLNLTSWFAPFNWSSLNSADLDLGSGGVVLIPGTALLLSGGKAGVLYLVNKDNMGGISSGSADTNIVQSWSLGGHSIHGGPVWWDAPDGSYAYIWAASSDHLRQYKFDRVAGKFPSTTPYAQSVTVGGSGQPGAILALSANGSTAGSGIIWAAINTANNANQAVVAGTLHAYNAQNVAKELWNSDMLGSRDGLGNFAKFVAPTVANGKVYMATFSNRLNVYGLLPTNTPALLSVSPGSLNYGELTAGQTSNKTFQVVNKGGLPITNGTVSLTGGPFAVVSGTPFTVPALGSNNVVVRFAPVTAGSFSNAAVFASNGGGSTNALVGLGAVMPAAGFVATPTNGTSPLQVNFIDSSTGTITNRFWAFGDGATSNSTVTNLTHLYGAAGTNTVSLTVSGPVGTNTIARPNYIIVTNLGPVTVTIAVSGNQLELSWPSGTLQSAGVVTGPYTNIVDAVSPYKITPSSAPRFFRVQVH
jgi:PKD repeat protein